jgi:hypothetical protein
VWGPPGIKQPELAIDHCPSSRAEVILLLFVHGLLYTNNFHPHTIGYCIIWPITDKFAYS